MARITDIIREFLRKGDVLLLTLCRRLARKIIFFFQGFLFLIREGFYRRFFLNPQSDALRFHFSAHYCRAIKFIGNHGL